MGCRLRSVDDRKYPMLSFPLVIRHWTCIIGQCVFGFCPAFCYAALCLYLPRTCLRWASYLRVDEVHKCVCMEGTRPQWKYQLFTACVASPQAVIMNRRCWLANGQHTFFVTLYILTLSGASRINTFFRPSIFHSHPLDACGVWTTLGGKTSWGTSGWKLRGRLPGWWSPNAKCCSVLHLAGTGWRDWKHSVVREIANVDAFEGQTILVDFVSERTAAAAGMGARGWA